MSAYTIGTGFSGIGVPDLAAHLLGIETLWQIERDPYCLKVLERHFPDAERYTDIFEASHLPYTDIQVYGFPCQPFSLAGKREGVKDERYLVPEMLRVIDETRPRVVVLENVPGFASIADGDTFKLLLGALADLGFDAEWGHLAAQDFGAPHRRERWWCICKATGVGLADASGLRRQSGWPEQPLSRAGAYGESRELADTDGGRQQQRHAGQRCVSIADAGGATVAYTANSGADRRFGESGNASVGGEQWGGRQRTVGNGGAEDLGHAHRAGRREQRRAVSVRPQQPAAERTGGRGAEPRLGGNAHGIAGGLDFRAFPVGPGQQQHDAEPPRVTTGKQADRAKRLKALGNTMQLDVAYEVLKCVLAWLQEVDRDWLAVAEAYQAQGQP